jgi:hypothetical protein
VWGTVAVIVVAVVVMSTLSLRGSGVVVHPRTSTPLFHETASNGAITMSLTIDRRVVDRGQPVVGILRARSRRGVPFEWACSGVDFRLEDGSDHVIAPLPGMNWTTYCARRSVVDHFTIPTRYFGCEVGGPPYQGVPPCSLPGYPDLRAGRYHALFRLGPPFPVLTSVPIEVR